MNDRELIATEYQEGCAFMDWARTNPLLRRFLIHIPNEGKRSWHLGKKFKHLGVKSGVSDYFLPIPIEPFHGLWLELKRTKFYKVTTAQMEWLYEMRRLGYSAHIAYGAEHAIALVSMYLDRSPGVVGHEHELSTISGDKCVDENV